MHAQNQHWLEHSRADALAELCVGALIDEAELSPKPGLVDRRGNGAHTDLTLGLMHASAYALRPGYLAMATTAQAMGEVSPELRQELGRLGRDAEADMLRVTGGVNTHRGGIWALGLLAAAAALLPGAPARAVAECAGRIARLEDPGQPVGTSSHGAQVQRRFSVPGARGQAQQGFPAVIGQGLPQLHASRAAGAGEQNARLDALLAIMAQLDDTCVLYRAGQRGLTCLQQGARAVLEAGGAATLAGRRRLRTLDQQLLSLNASPGGGADLLAATLFLDRLSNGAQAPDGSC